MDDTPPTLDESHLHRVVLAAISDAVFITDDDGRFTFICPNAHVIFGYGEHEVAELGSIQRLLGDDLFHLPALRRDGEISNIERTVRDKDKQEHVLLINVKRVSIGRGRVLYTCRDISRRKQDELMLLQYQRELRSMASELTLAEERERRRIATALHDVVGQTLVAAKMKMGALRADHDSPDAAQRIREALELIDRTIQHSRDLTFELSPPVLHDLGLAPALEWLVEQRVKDSGFDIRLQTRGRPEKLSEDIKFVLFRCARELLFNVHKHADATRVDITLDVHPRRAALVVEDDGKGMAVDALRDGERSPQGFGLFSIRERIHHLGGEIDVQSEPGRGTRIEVIVPLKLFQHAPDSEKNHDDPDSAG